MHRTVQLIVYYAYGENPYLSLYLKLIPEGGAEPPMRVLVVKAYIASPRCVCGNLKHFLFFVLPLVF